MYFYNLNSGNLFYENDSRGKVRVCGSSDRIAVVFDTEDGILHKHGELSAVSAWFTETRNKLGRSQIGKGLADHLTLISMPVNEETVRELNRCVHVSGAAMSLEVRLQMLQAVTTEIEAFKGDDDTSSLTKPIGATM